MRRRVEAGAVSLPAIPALLAKNLEPLMPHLKTPGLIDLCINRPGIIFLDTQEGWVKRKDNNLNLKTLLHLGRVLATESDQVFSDRSPFLACSIPNVSNPDYGHRVQIVAGSAVLGGFAMSVRLAPENVRPITDWTWKERAPEARPGNYEPIYIDDTERIINAFRKKATILIVGQTRTGKTSLVNTLISHLDLDERLITIEDVVELRIPHENCVRLVRSRTGTGVAGVSYEMLTETTKRLRPDRVFIGELGIDNTYQFIDILNSGHQGCIASLHANSPDLAVDKLVQNASFKHHTNSEIVKKVALELVDIIIKIKWDRLGRGYTAQAVMLNDKF